MFLWILLGISGFFWVPLGSSEFFCVPLSSCGYFWVNMDFSEVLWVFLGSSGFLLTTNLAWMEEDERYNKKKEIQVFNKVSKF